MSADAGTAIVLFTRDPRVHDDPDPRAAGGDLLIRRGDPAAVVAEPAGRALDHPPPLVDLGP